MKKYYILTYGCQMNKSDSERIASTLENKGCKKALNINGADLIVVNMCSVRQSAVDRVFGISQKLARLKCQKPKLKTILTGCILKSDKSKFREKFDAIWDNKDYINVPLKYQSDLMAFIPISNGCNNFCAYCVVPFVRGPLICRDHKKILAEIKSIVKKKVNPIRGTTSNGAREIWLLGQNVNDYNSPTKKSINFPKLLKMIDDIPGDFRLKFTSPNPKNFSDELINVMAESEKITHYLNLPVQSGDNEILKKMNRPYTVQQYKTLVKKIRKKIPDIFLSTDAIVGFPGESKSQFENTVKLFKEINFDMAYISEFSPRPETAAAKMKDTVSHREKEKRWRILNQFIVKNIKERRSNEKKKLIVILGPTASGKSELAVKLAEKFNGEVVSADSRQVYKGMDIGTGKITPDTKNSSNFNTGQAKKKYVFTHKGIPHYCIDVASPKRRFSVAQYRKLATKTINKIFNKGKIPILCGGTGFYIQAVVDGIIIPEVKPDWKLRKKLEEMTAEALFKKLKKVDPKRAKTIDRKNRRRLIRALEIVIKTKKPVPDLKINPLPYPVLMIGIKKEGEENKFSSSPFATARVNEELKKLIEKRFLKWLKQGLIKEVKKLKKLGLSWKKIEDFGIHYRVIAQYLQNKINYKKMIENSLKELQNYAKRQMTWFKRDKGIHWVKSQKEAEKLVKRFLEK